MTTTNQYLMFKNVKVHLIVRWKMNISNYFIWLWTLATYFFLAMQGLLSRVNKKCVHALYKNCVKEFIVSFLPVQKQTYGYNCGPFAIAFAAEILDGKSTMETCFDVEGMRGHLINCLENKFLIPFPKAWSHLNVWGAATEKQVFYKTGSVLQVFCRKQNTTCSTPMVKNIARIKSQSILRGQEGKG